MENQFKNKYLKYKSKYLKLKNLIGGGAYQPRYLDKNIVFIKNIKTNKYLTFDSINSKLILTTEKNGDNSQFILKLIESEYPDKTVKIRWTIQSNHNKNYFKLNNIGDCVTLDKMSDNLKFEGDSEGFIIKNDKGSVLRLSNSNNCIISESKDGNKEEYYFTFELIPDNPHTGKYNIDTGVINSDILKQITFKNLPGEFDRPELKSAIVWGALNRENLINDIPEADRLKYITDNIIMKEKETDRACRFVKYYDNFSKIEILSSIKSLLGL